MGTETCLSMRNLFATSANLQMISNDNMLIKWRPRKVARSLHEFPNPGLAQYSDLLLGEWWAPALCLKLSQRPRCWDLLSQELATKRSLFSPGGSVSRSPSFNYDLYAGRVTTVPTQIWFGSSWWRAMKEVTSIMRHGATYRALDGSCAWRTGSRPFTLAKPAPLGKTTRMGSVSQARFGSRSFEVGLVEWLFDCVKSWALS